MFPAVPRAVQLRIITTAFINFVPIFAPIKIGKPGFDSPSGNEYRHHVIAGAGLDILFLAFVIEAPDATLNAPVVPVDHDRKVMLNLVTATAAILEFLRKVFTNSLLSRPLFARCLFHPDFSFVPAHLDKKISHEDLLLLVLDEQNKLNLATHVSQPLARISDNFKPLSGSAEISESALILVAPDPSRSSDTPCSAPR